MASEMERILGRRFKSKSERTIPGASLSSVGRKVIYVSEDTTIELRKIFHDLLGKTQPFLPKDGGAILAGCMITLPDGRRFHAVSFKGDIPGWSKQIELGASKADLLSLIARADVPAKGTLAELEQYLSGAISQVDAKIIKDIAFYFC
jgi:hypothetical protein